MATLKEQIQQALNLPDTDFSNHESDLYVKASPAVGNWLKQNYEFHQNTTMFRSQVDGLLWIEIPFGYMDEHFSSKYPSRYQKLNFPELCNN